MVRVLHSVSNMDRAGIETMLMNYYRHMDRDKVQFDFLCNKKKPGAYDDEVKSLGGRIYHTPGLNPAKYPQYLKYMKTLFGKHPEYKIVEAHNGAFGVYALYAAKVNNIPNRIYHAHGASITVDLKMPLKLVCKKMLSGNMNHHYTCGIAAAEFYFGKQVVKEGNFELIPNAIEVDRFVYNEAVRNEIRRKYALEGRHVIGHVGRFMTQKNHTFLLDVFSEYAKVDNQAYLCLLGDGELMDSMKAKAKKLGIEQKVTFAGNVGNANEWYQAFDCFILPSVWEGLPVVGVEAQAADLPCIFSDSITKEIRFSEKAKFISLGADKKEWVNALSVALRGNKGDTGNDRKDENAKNTGHARQDRTQLITEHNYNIKMEAVKLQERYLKMAGVNK